MRKILFLAVGIFSLSVSAVRAQELPAADLAVGYSYFREGFSNGVNANGGTAAFTGYANRWLGITGDFGAYHASPFGVSANTYTFLVGPRFSSRHSARAAPFAQVPVGRGSSYCERPFRLDQWICLERRRRNRLGPESSPGIPAAV